MNTFHDNPFFVFVDDLDSCSVNFAEEGKIVEIADTGCEARVFDETLKMTEDPLIITDNREGTKIKQNNSNLDGKFREHNLYSSFNELLGLESKWTAAGIGDSKMRNLTNHDGRDKKQADRFDRCTLETGIGFTKSSDERRGDPRDNRTRKSPESIPDHEKPRSKSKSRNVWENRAKGKYENDSSSGNSKIQTGATSMFGGKTYVDEAVDKDSIASSSSGLQVPVIFEPPPRIRSASRESWLLGPALRLSSANRTRNISPPARKILEKNVPKFAGEPRFGNVKMTTAAISVTPTSIESKIPRSKLPLFKSPNRSFATTSRSNAIPGNAASADVSSPLPETNQSERTNREVPTKNVVASIRYSCKLSDKVLARRSRKSYDLPSRSALPSATRSFRTRMAGRDWRAVDGRWKGRAMGPRLLSDRGKNRAGTSTKRSTDVKALPRSKVMDDPREEIELQSILADDACSLQRLDGERAKGLASLKTTAGYNSESSSKIVGFVEIPFVGQTRPLRSTPGECSSTKGLADKSRRIQDRRFQSEVRDFHSSRVLDSRKGETNVADGSCVETLKHQYPTNIGKDVGVEIRSKISEAEKEEEMIPIMKQSTYHQQPFAEKRPRGDALPQPEAPQPDGRRMDAWISGHEQAYLKGRAIGLRVADTARAAKQQMAREFFRSGLPTVASLPTADKSQEIVDIGVSIIENVLGDKTNRNRSLSLRDSDVYSFVGFDTKAKWTDRRWIL